MSENIFTIKQFNEATLDDYFRTYLFKVIIDNFTCEWVASTATPVTMTSAQNIDYMHTQIKRGGRTTPQQWTVSIRDDGQAWAYGFFSDWRHSIYPHMSSTLPSSYKRIATVEMVNPTATSFKPFTLYGVWPGDIGSVTLDYESDGIAIFPVTLYFDYFKTADGLGG